MLQPAKYVFREDATRFVPAVLAIALAGLLALQIAQVLRSPRSALNILGEQPVMPVLVLLGFAGAVSLALRETIITIGSGGVEQRIRMGPFHRTHTYSIENVDVRVEVFSFDPWDAHVALHCGKATIRVGWGLPEERLRAVAADMRMKVETARTASPARAQTAG